MSFIKCFKLITDKEPVYVNEESIVLVKVINEKTTVPNTYYAQVTTDTQGNFYLNNEPLDKASAELKCTTLFGPIKNL